MAWVPGRMSARWARAPVWAFTVATIIAIVAAGIGITTTASAAASAKHAADFYRRFGFIPFPATPERLFLPLSDFLAAGLQPWVREPVIRTHGIML
jgi:hypothetical protein